MLFIFVVTIVINIVAVTITGLLPRRSLKQHFKTSKQHRHKGGIVSLFNSSK